MLRGDRTFLVAELDIPARSDAAAWADSVFTFLEGLDDPKARVHGVSPWQPGDVAVFPLRGHLYRSHGFGRQARYHETNGRRVLLPGSPRILRERSRHTCGAEREVRRLLRTHADDLRAHHLHNAEGYRAVLRDIAFTIRDGPDQEPVADLEWVLPGNRRLPCTRMTLPELRNLPPRTS